MRSFDENGNVKYTRRDYPNWDFQRIPYLEIKGNLLIGIWPSRSDIRRIYALVVDVDNGTYTCHTNNNRMCSGLRSGVCKHISYMINLANAKFGNQRTGKFNLGRLKADGKARYGWIFSEFLVRARFFEKPSNLEDISEMIFFRSN